MSFPIASTHSRIAMRLRWVENFEDCPLSTRSHSQRIALPSTSRCSIMRLPNHSPFLVPLALVSLAMLPGCTYSVVHDNPSAPPNVVAHCQGSENVDDSSIAVVPIPVVAFLSPHAELHQLEPEDYLNRCGQPTRLVNRDVTLDKTDCIPASVTEIVTLGIWQWCPATISYTADVVGPTQPARMSSTTESTVADSNWQSTR
jgi:hypothetical protein